MNNERVTFRNSDPKKYQQILNDLYKTQAAIAKTYHAVNKADMAFHNLNLPEKLRELHMKFEQIMIEENNTIETDESDDEESDDPRTELSLDIELLSSSTKDAGEKFDPVVEKLDRMIEDLEVTTERFEKLITRIKAVKKATAN
jgi:hypothetical protein